MSVTTGRSDTTDCTAALNAGIDLFMAPDSWQGLFDATLREARDGTVPLTRLDDAVRRVLRVKFKLGLMGPNPVVRGDAAQVGAPDHLALAREAAAKSLVLLKNESGLLPLRPGATVLITGDGADSMAMQTGGWTITWQGSDTTAADFPNGRTIGRAIMEQVRSAGGEAALSESGSFNQRPDVAVVVVGEKPYAEFQGDVPDFAYRAAPEETALIARLKAQGIKIVTVFLSGRPLFTGPLINQSDAMVAAWLPGTQGNGEGDVLVAQRSGKVPAPWHLAADGAIADAMDLGAQEDARQFSWARPGALSIEGPPVSLTRELDEGFVLLLEWRIDRAVPGPLVVALGGGSLDLGTWSAPRRSVRWCRPVCR